MPEQKKKKKSTLVYFPVKKSTARYFDLLKDYEILVGRNFRFVGSLHKMYYLPVCACNGHEGF